MLRKPIKVQDYGFRTLNVPMFFKEIEDAGVLVADLINEGLHCKILQGIYNTVDSGSLLHYLKRIYKERYSKEEQLKMILFLVPEVVMQIFSEMKEICGEQNYKVKKWYANVGNYSKERIEGYGFAFSVKIEQIS